MSSNQLTGARYLAEALKKCGVSDVFFIDAILRRSLVEMEQVGINRVLVHAEKTAAYMADGYARVGGRIGVCMAQSVGAANLAAGLQDAYLHRSPVLTLTGRKPPMHRYRNAYQEIEHAPLFADTGYSGIWTGTMVELKHGAQTYLRAAGSLGWSFPASLGAKCAAPERPVVCFSGDGALYYHLSELETARRRGLAVVLVVNNNSAFAQGLPNIRNIYGETPGNPDEIIRFGPSNFAAIARAFGVEGIRVEDPQDLRPALDRALAMNAPVVVDVVTDPEARAPAAWSPPA